MAPSAEFCILTRIRPKHDAAIHTSSGYADRFKAPRRDVKINPCCRRAGRCRARAPHRGAPIGASNLPQSLVPEQPTDGRRRRQQTNNRKQQRDDHRQRRPRQTASIASRQQSRAEHRQQHVYIYMNFHVSMHAMPIHIKLTSKQPHLHQKVSLRQTSSVFQLKQEIPVNLQMKNSMRLFMPTCMLMRTKHVNTCVDEHTGAGGCMHARSENAYMLMRPRKPTIESTVSQTCHMHADQKLHGCYQKPIQ
jgi:hypothetical protein